jgi:hypothetical protein
VRGENLGLGGGVDLGESLYFWDMKEFELVGGFRAVEVNDGQYKVKYGKEIASPFRYDYFEEMTDGVVALQRENSYLIDLLFADGTWIMAISEAYTLLEVKKKKGFWALIVVLDAEGTHIFDNTGEKLFFFDGYPNISVVMNAAILVYEYQTPGPYVHAYDFRGHKIAEGMVHEVRRKVHLYLVERAMHDGRA